MAWQSTPYTVPLFVSTALSLVLAGYVAYVYATDRSERSFLALSVTMAAIGWWSFAHAVQLSSTTLGTKFLWLKLMHFAPLTIPAAFLVFALLYTDYDRWVTPGAVAVLAVEPVATLLILWTNPAEGGLMWAGTGLDAGGAVVTLERTLGPWYLFNVAYSYVLLGSAFLVLGQAFLSASTVYRGQLAAVLMASGVPFVTHVSFVARVLDVNLTSLAFGVSGLAVSYAILRYRFLDLVPVARDTVIENMRDGYVVVDPEGRVVDLNPAARAVVEAAGDDDVDPGDVVGSDAATVVPADEAVITGDGGSDDPPGEGASGGTGESTEDAAGADGPAEDVPADGDGPGDGSHDDPTDGSPADGAGGSGPPDFGRRLEDVVVENGQQRYLELDVTPLSAEDRDIGRLVTLRDVTGRRRVEKRYQALIEHASDLITVVDRDGTITYQSPSIERIVGMAPGTVEGLNVFEYVHPDDEGRLREEFERGIDEPGYVARFEFRLLDAEGEYRVFEGLGRNLLDEPAVEGVVINARDVTERVERERELERQNERLEEFAGVVSHDLRNPLGVARGHLSTVPEGVEGYEGVEEALTSLDRMEAIVDDVLTLARQGQTVGDTETVDLETVARRAWANVETPGAALRVADSRDVSADPDRLLALFENCFRNALEHGRPDGAADPGGDAASEGPAVTVTVGTTFEGFYVADDGPGIPEDRREAVFESGYTTDPEGTGFGLAIVARIAEAHGWEVTAGESTDGGARFDVEGVERVIVEDHPE